MGRAIGGVLLRDKVRGRSLSALIGVFAVLARRKRTKGRGFEFLRAIGLECLVWLGRRDCSIYIPEKSHTGSIDCKLIAPSIGVYPLSIDYTWLDIESVCKKRGAMLLSTSYLYGQLRQQMSP